MVTRHSFITVRNALHHSISKRIGLSIVGWIYTRHIVGAVKAELIWISSLVLDRLGNLTLASLAILCVHGRGSQIIRICRVWIRDGDSCLRVLLVPFAPSVASVRFYSNNNDEGYSKHTTSNRDCSR